MSSSSTGRGQLWSSTGAPSRIWSGLRNPDDPHLPAWRRFNQTIGTDGSVGIWHETYAVEPGHHEAIYNNMPVFGLAKASEHVPAQGRLETARRRLRGGENEPAVPSPE